MAAPANDNFSNAIELTGISTTATGTNVESTGETGEPIVSTTATILIDGVPTSFSLDGTTYTSNANTVWWKWTAPVSGLTTIDTNGSGTADDIDTVLGIYTGNAVDSLTLIGSNDDLDSVNTYSSVTFSAVEGTTYYIQVDGFDFGK